MLLAVAVAVAGLIYALFRGDLTTTTQLTLLSARAGLVVEPGAKVTYNGVEIGRVSRIGRIETGGDQQARLTLDVDPRYLALIPANVAAEIRATTVFGNKYIALSSPEHPVAQRLSNADVIDASGVTTEFNTLFETVTSLAEQVDPVKLNQTLAATAEALTGLGDRFGESLLDGNSILDDLNARMPAIREDIALLADLASVYAEASPDLFDALENAATTARALTDQRGDIDAALIGALGFADTGADVFERAGPYLVRGAADLLPTAKLFDDYRGMILCTIRKFNKVQSQVADTLGGNGYSLATMSGAIAGAGNPYVFPDNLPRVNARGGPEGRPGCWHDISRELWPGPYLVMDTGASIAPYNHAELGQPLFIEYVWGRQIGENTINP